MIIFHCADLHLDSKMESNLSSQKAQERQTELVDTFSRMVKKAQSRKAKVILIAGDLFDTKKTKQKNVKKSVAFIIQQAPEIDFLYLRGNHDDEDYFSDIADEVPNLKFFSKDSWTTYDYANVSITARELFNDTISDSIYSDLVLDKSKINIVSLHGQISKSDKKTDAPFINLSRLENKNIDYLALGHIHSFSYNKLDSRGVWCYPGCLEGRGFDETGDKGYVELEILDDENSSEKNSNFIEKNFIDKKSIEKNSSDKKIVRHFVPLSKRRLHEIQVDLTNLFSFFEISQKIKSTLSEAALDDKIKLSQNDLVKIVLTGVISEETEIDLDLFFNEFSPLFYFVKIEDKTQTLINYEKYRNEISLKGEFVRTVEAENIPDEEKSKIIILGLKALAGKEIK